jgi:hypothetical protein
MELVGEPNEVLVVDDASTDATGLVAQQQGAQASATRVISTGDLVQVDGNRGCVSVLKRLAEEYPAEIRRPLPDIRNGPRISDSKLS